MAPALHTATQRSSSSLGEAHRARSTAYSNSTGTPPHPERRAGCHCSLLHRRPTPPSLRSGFSKWESWRSFLPGQNGSGTLPRHVACASLPISECFKRPSKTAFYSPKSTVKEPLRGKGQTWYTGRGHEMARKVASHPSPAMCCPLLAWCSVNAES